MARPKEMHWYNAPNARLIAADVPLLCLGLRPRETDYSFIPFKNGTAGPTIRYRDDEVVPMAAVPTDKKMPFAALRAVTKVDPAVITGTGFYVNSNGAQVYVKAKVGNYWVSGPDANGAYFNFDAKGNVVDPTTGAINPYASKIVRKA